MKAVHIAGNLNWQETEHTCVLSDSERHLAHVFECEGKWTAFDTTRPAKTNDGPRRIGVFPSFVEARIAVEGALGVYTKPKALTAGGSSASVF